jgi:F-type H+-transporting ATPase subunit epsilon
MITCQFVRPDRLLFQGEVESLVLVTETGELGVWPNHAPAIVALGDGVVRLHLPEAEGGGMVKVIVSGGYAEIVNDTVIVLADHARREDDIEKDVVLATRAEAVAKRDSLPVYYDNKIKWCDLLLKYA